jgi:23S rRNA C2498 (ribose-2'-O)-methylase RlmM
MKLATYKDGSRDGQLLVVSRDLATAHFATGIATRLQQVLDDWNFLSPQLQDLYVTLNQGKARLAFEFVPEGPVDWLFCDMAWRPLEVAQLLGKWARRRWATHLVCNIKLPMKDKLPMVVAARGVLEAAGWRHLSTRQLYHDRDEITATARLLY